MIDRVELEENCPLEKQTKAKVAPKVAASDTPNVEGEAILLFKENCMTAPDIDNPIPTIIEAKALLNLMLPTIMLALLLPLPNNPFIMSISSRLFVSRNKAKQKEVNRTINSRISTKK